ncbi:MAG: DNA polymerase III subunit epsilon [Gammaproteobacteria bacterium]|nr:DNA polymerase III subunit epsilon [Gammaproteobacteria bacterium]
MRQIILDTETTGLKVVEGHRVIEIGCIELIDRRLTQQTFHYYLNPDREIEQGAKAIHCIDEAFLQAKPRFGDIAAEFLEFIRDAELIIHNAPFDVGFLDAELKRTTIRPAKLTKYCQVIDTLKLARQRHPGQQNNLNALCKRYHVSNKHREWHGALLDAELLAQVYLMMTGGQTSLFAETQSSTASQQKQGGQAIEEVFADTVVMYADENELLAHKQFMAMLQERQQTSN